MLSSENATPRGADFPVLAFEYQPPVSEEAKAVGPAVEAPKEPQVLMPESEFKRRLASSREAGVAETESRLSQEYEAKYAEQTAKVYECLKDFQQKCDSYFSRVEAEVVQLALGIARKILHRESQVDPTLVAAIVQIAMGQLKEGSVVSLRVSPGEISRWKDHLAQLNSLLTVGIEEDDELQPGDCVLETEVGHLNVSVEGQLKEIERGFLDVLAQRPRS